MCRYAFHTYKAHFACFSCRKAFKKTAIDDYVEHVGIKAAFQKIVAVYSMPSKREMIEAELGISYEDIKNRYLTDVSVCPQCGNKMAAMGLDFRPPPNKDREAWDILTVLYERGFAFKGCGCNVGYSPPRKRSELNMWLKQHTKIREGERLLDAISQR